LRHTASTQAARHDSLSGTARSHTHAYGDHSHSHAPSTATQHIALNRHSHSRFCCAWRPTRAPPQAPHRWGLPGAGTCRLQHSHAAPQRTVLHAYILSQTTSIGKRNGAQSQRSCSLICTLRQPRPFLQGVSGIPWQRSCPHSRVSSRMRALHSHASAPRASHTACHKLSTLLGTSCVQDRALNLILPRPCS